MFEVEPGLIIWTTVSFVILLGLLYKLLLPPLLDTIEKREKQIRDSLGHAEQSKLEAQEMLSEYKKKMDDAHRAAEGVIQNSKLEAQEVINKAAESAKHEAQIIITQAKAEIESEKKKMFNEVKAISADLIVAASSRVLKREVKKEDNARIIDESLNDFAKL